MKILIVDDHSLIREALRGLLKKLKRDAQVFEAAAGCQAFETIAAHPDISLVLLDLNLPDGDGSLMLAELRQRYPATAIVVMSADQSREAVMKALDRGAVGYIPKSSRREVMTGALQLIFAGGQYIPPEILQRDPLPVSTTSGQPSGRPIVTPSEVGLSDRQLQVLTLLMQGKSNKMICRALNLAEPTVKNHVTFILRALKVSNRVEAVIAVNELGWKLPALNAQT